MLDPLIVWSPRKYFKNKTQNPMLTPEQKKVKSLIRSSLFGHSENTGKAQQKIKENPSKRYTTNSTVPSIFLTTKQKNTKKLRINVKTQKTESLK
jgi:hypothetical protein